MNGSKVSLKDIYDVVNRLEDKIDRRMCDVENRVDVLEDFRGKVLGMAAMISVMAGTIAAWVWRKVTGE